MSPKPGSVGKGEAITNKERRRILRTAPCASVVRYSAYLIAEDPPMMAPASATRPAVAPSAPAAAAVPSERATCNQPPGANGWRRDCKRR
ncbi:Protein of unknown function [Gryllus bimaculatus]|nr:Protein of unknown function [Gryllus bimaculatus]